MASLSTCHLELVVLDGNLDNILLNMLIHDSNVVGCFSWTYVGCFSWTYVGCWLFLVDLWCSPPSTWCTGSEAHCAGGHTVFATFYFVHRQRGALCGGIHMVEPVVFCRDPFRRVWVHSTMLSSLYNIVLFVTFPCDKC